MSGDTDDAYTGELDLLVDQLDDGSLRVVLSGKVVVDEINGERLTFGDLSKVLERYSLSAEQREFLMRNRQGHVRYVEWHNLMRQDELDHLKAQQRIQRPPAYFLDNWLRILVSKKSYERIYSQIIIDTREEYFEALAARRETKARWILVRCYLSAAWAWLLMVPTSVSVAIFKKLSGS